MRAPYPYQPLTLFHFSFAWNLVLPFTVFQSFSARADGRVCGFASSCRGQGSNPPSPPFKQGGCQSVATSLRRRKATEAIRFREIAADFVLATFGIAASLGLLAMTGVDFFWLSAAGCWLSDAISSLRHSDTSYHRDTFLCRFALQ
jgi:hypothetical protein